MTHDTTQDPTPRIPYGYCQCGCGQKTTIARQTFTKRGITRGEPHRYVHGHGRRKQTSAERFWQRVRQTDDGSCWLWTGTLNKTGYGTLGIGSTVDGTVRTMLAHRLSYELNIGPIPKGMVVRHKCDVSQCVNPSHLELGSQLENIGDALSRDHHSRPPHPKGNAHHNRKLTEDDVRTIRQAVAEGQKQADLARHYSVQRSVISQIVNHKTWTHVP